MENFGLLKFLKSPYPAIRPDLHGNSSATEHTLPKNNETDGKNLVIPDRLPPNNGEIYLCFIEKQCNISKKIGKKQ